MSLYNYFLLVYFIAIPRMKIATVSLVVIFIHLPSPSLTYSHTPLLTYTNTLILSPYLHSYTALDPPIINSLNCILSIHCTEDEVLHFLYISFIFILRQHTLFSIQYNIFVIKQLLREHFTRHMHLSMSLHSSTQNAPLRIPRNNVLLKRMFFTYRIVRIFLWCLAQLLPSYPSSNAHKLSFQTSNSVQITKFRRKKS